MLKRKHVLMQIVPINIVILQDALIIMQIVLVLVKQHVVSNVQVDFIQTRLTTLHASHVQQIEIVPMAKRPRNARLGNGVQKASQAVNLVPLALFVLGTKIHNIALWWMEKFPTQVKLHVKTVLLEYTVGSQQTVRFDKTPVQLDLTHLLESLSVPK